ncbi:glycosyltransferase family 2 protein [Flavobacterium caseinilyticum]|uniref:Glycosyltransferase family 2 protein n=1 Tax=Flavobacterium caseinilyticum TaxID=2541732 RepID=A0A4R5AUG3_9FLAO|nr:glycosyltransferase family 2 protein [Flavobacterium caseinilyticum]TDD76988.1 glycosyltransferase family 2 protein [Flavobacterium caseinilyticum]
MRIDFNNLSKIPVTVIVPVKNEEKNLPECLGRLKDFSEVIVVDSKSTDRTPEIVKDFGFQFVQFDWNGKFPKKRNWVLRNVEMRNEWVLFLDADEFVTKDFLEELRNKIIADEYSGFTIMYENYFMKKKLNYGDKMKKMPLFKVGSGEYEQIKEGSWSHLDMEIHEHPIISGKIGFIKSPIIHNDYKGLEHYIARHNAYSSWEANRYVSLNSSNYGLLTSRQKLKYKLMKIGLLPIVYFIATYFFKFGFLDGKEGFYFAKYKSQYFFQIKTKIIELQS